ncbi:patatin-like phospholipase family protein [Nocardia sp. NPDC060220]|uniref:patatin-like phospholipase family protein n=1 Tax=Nocardia sp. NPDC060220 TaxID=3347076 RepID=UPI003658E715
MKIGLILGGGGEVGVAWETGVLAGLAEHAGFSVTDCAVTVGTSAGSIVGAIATSGADLAERARGEQRGAYATSWQLTQHEADDDQVSAGTAAIPPEMLHLLVSTEGSIQERARAIGKLILTSTPANDDTVFAQIIASLLPDSVADWPDTDLRVSSVHCETGDTVLWKRADGIDLTRAIASSCAVPGLFPPVAFGGSHYCDTRRTSTVAALTAEKNLDAIVFIGPSGGALANTAEEAELEAVSRQGVRVVKITEGPDFAEVGNELLDTRLRPRAAQIGLEDARRYVTSIAELR